MRSNLTGLLVRAAIYAGIVALAALAPWVDVLGYDLGTVRMFHEPSVLESTQFGVLVVSILLLLSSKAHPQHGRGLQVLMIAALVCAGIRELDYYLDQAVFDGAWQLLVAITLMLCLAFAISKRKRLVSAIEQFANQVSFGLLSAGFLTTLIFSRLLGRSELWEEVMGATYQRSIKNLVEESVELLGYTLILIGVVEFVLNIHRVIRSQLISNRTLTSVPSVAGYPRDLKGVCVVKRHSVG